MTSPRGRADNGRIQTKPQSEFRPRSSEATAPGESTHSTGWLILLWYAGLAAAALLSYRAMGAESTVKSAALAGGAIAIPLVLLGHTMRSYGAVMNSHVLVPAIGPMVILVLILDYVEYNRHLEDAQSAQLISADLLSVTDVKWASGNSGASARLSGHIANRSPHELVGMSLELMLYGGGREVSSARTDATVDVAPGAQGNFTAIMPHLAADSATQLPCQRIGPAPPALPDLPGGLECFFRVTATRGQEVFF